MPGVLKTPYFYPVVLNIASLKTLQVYLESIKDIPTGEIFVRFLELLARMWNPPSAIHCHEVLYPTQEEQANEYIKRLLKTLREEQSKDLKPGAQINDSQRNFIDELFTVQIKCGCGTILEKSIQTVIQIKSSIMDILRSLKENFTGKCCDQELKVTYPKILILAGNFENVCDSLTVDCFNYSLSGICGSQTGVAYVKKESKLYLYSNSEIKVCPVSLLDQYQDASLLFYENL